MAGAKDHADNEQFWRIAIFSLLSRGSQAGGMAGAQFFMRQLLRRRREGSWRWLADFLVAFWVPIRS